MALAKLCIPFGVVTWSTMLQSDLKTSEEKSFPWKIKARKGLRSDFQGKTKQTPSLENMDE